ncbi:MULTISPECIES: hypothetical protein [Bacillus]|uniref:Uncharacterized protein n=2 Tax=Bacillus TaxID=1386 RepID=A0A0M3R9G0_9BACI|nr:MULTISPECIES: hypothetical protein [Bacillus]ALC81372.1 hypothetical protein AM592_07005 [Bacillus gobiensis]MBP1080394.1 hypothetical protein [Bacillus capparidis]MED1094253.1 hypothetical protein [Bacillus capparidis]
MNNSHYDLIEKALDAIEAELRNAEALDEDFQSIFNAKENLQKAKQHQSSADHPFFNMHSISRK